MPVLSHHIFSEDFIQKININQQNILKKHNHLVKDSEDKNSKIRGYNKQLITDFKNASALKLLFINSNEVFLNQAMESNDIYQMLILKREKLALEIAKVKSDKKKNEMFIKQAPFKPYSFWGFYFRLISEYFDIIINHPTTPLEEKASKNLQTHFSKIASCAVVILITALPLGLGIAFLAGALPIVGAILLSISIALIFIIFTTVALLIKKDMHKQNASNLISHQEAVEKAKTKVSTLHEQETKHHIELNDTDKEIEDLFIEFKKLPSEYIEISYSERPPSSNKETFFTNPENTSFKEYCKIKIQLAKLDRIVEENEISMVSNSVRI